MEVERFPFPDNFRKRGSVFCFKNALQFWRLIWFFSVLSLVLFPSPALAIPGPLPPPDGFERVSRAPGIEMYQKNYQNGSPDYIQVIDLDLGAQVHVLHGGIAIPGQGGGVYGGDNPRFGRQSIQQFWRELKGLSAAAFCVTNGQFFRLADSPTPLPFPLKKGGVILSDGYGIKEFPGQKLILEIWPDRLDIRELTKETLYGSSAPDIVAGLTEDAEKASKKAVGRTFIGIRDQDGDDNFETLMVLNTRIARPSEAAEVLRSFGAEKLMMLDGGGSTQLVCQDGIYINTDRLIPQALGIAAAELSPLAARLVGVGEIPILVSGQTQASTFSIRNRGSETWQPADTQLIFEDDGGSRQAISPESPIASGEYVEIAYTPPSTASFGLHQATVALVSKDVTIPVEAGIIRWVTIPVELASQSGELRHLLDEGASQPGSDLEQQVQEWILQQQQKRASGTGGAGIKPVENPPEIQTGSEQIAPRALKIDINDVVWIPCVIIPLISLILGIIRRTQQQSGFE